MIEAPNFVRFVLKKEVSYHRQAVMKASKIRR
jgi:hypothetical protein